MASLICVIQMCNWLQPDPCPLLVIETEVFLDKSLCGDPYYVFEIKLDDIDAREKV